MFDLKPYLGLALLSTLLCCECARTYTVKVNWVYFEGDTPAQQIATSMQRTKGVYGFDTVWVKKLKGQEVWIRGKK